jgi:sorbitol-specific phosphotransferase system component IIC
MRFIKKITFIICFLLTLTFSSCFTEEKKPTYDELLEEHDKNKSGELFGMIVVGAIFCYIVYRMMKDDK